MPLAELVFILIVVALFVAFVVTYFVMKQVYEWHKEGVKKLEYLSLLITETTQDATMLIEKVNGNNVSNT